MSIIVKYYHLESRSWDQVNSLEKTLRNYTFRIPRVKPDAAPHNVVALFESAVIPSSSSESEAAFLATAFELLHYEGIEVQKRRDRWFGRPNIPEVVSVKFLVRGEVDKVHHFEEDVGKDFTFNLRMLESKVVTHGTISFKTKYIFNAHTLRFKESLSQYLVGIAPPIYSDLRTSNSDQYQANYCQGIIRGTAEQILPIWKMLVGEGYGVTMNSKDIVFYGESTE